jgi:opacity protein-like surface antigen
VSFMLNVFLELKEVLHLDLGRFSPYLGGGAGLAHNHIGKMTYQFPGLTRHKISITPSGSETDFAYMVAVGTGVRLSRSLVLDLSYRYSDLGRIRTESGNMYLDSLPGGIDIGETSAPLRTHGFMVGLRYNFGD